MGRRGKRWAGREEWGGVGVWEALCVGLWPTYREGVVGSITYHVDILKTI